MGLDRLHATLAELGLPRTVIPVTLQEELDSIAREAGFAGWAELEAADLPPDEEQRVQERMLRSAALDRGGGIRSTAREDGDAAAADPGGMRRVRPRRAPRCGRPWAAR